ncbi:PucR family transcriptional regulator [Streptacidiphilus fuscans]|uniref:PucR family transcriptional regulator n=1 Tax=Streptacidiphilus fuscans TaxID=2789292 RepID=A0A931FIU0_9ACTN|nr:PucR family transcriptional regulator [Streptacidiphilus fuscans]MBF9073715.1 PucR family transcriptional regulator [Streptacidiphilus fuscans]
MPADSLADSPVLAGLTAVPLEVVLSDAGLGVRQVAGPVEDREVAMVHTSEWEDPSRYLLGGELLLTAGRHLGTGQAELDAYVERLVRARVAALGFGLAPVHDEVPQELLAACDRWGLPLLLVPPETPFVALSRVVHLAMAEARSRELRRMSRAQSDLAAAAARPDAVEAVLRQLAAHLGAWTALLDGDGHELVACGAQPGDGARQRLLALARARGRVRAAGSRVPEAAVEHVGEAQLILHTVPGAEGSGAESSGALQLALVTVGRQTSVDRSVAGMGVVLLSLLTGPRHALGTDESAAGALLRALLGAGAEELAPLLHPSGDAAASRWLVVAGRRSAARADGSARSARVHLAALGTALGTSYLEVDGDSLRAVIPLPESGDAGDFPDAVRLGWTLGVSAPAGTEDLRAAAAQAERALHRALATDRRTVRHPRDEAGVHSLVDPDEARTQARNLLAPLLSAGPPGADVLLETLHGWLSTHGSWDRTAVALGIHRNTVRQRVARVAALLDADLDDPGTRMELWFALRWLGRA